MAKKTKFGKETALSKHIKSSSTSVHKTARFFHPKTAFTEDSEGAADAGRPVVLDSTGKLDSSLVVGGGGDGYSKAEIDAFFEGESEDKKQVHWDRITNKLSTYPPSAHSHDWGTW